MKTTGKYILEHKVVIPCDDLMTWAMWIETQIDQMRVGYDQISKDVTVSTIFLGLDYSYGHGSPKFFETLILGGIYNGYAKKYTTWEEAEDGHKQAVELSKEGMYAEN